MATTARTPSLLLLDTDRPPVPQSQTTATGRWGASVRQRFKQRVTSPQSTNCRPAFKRSRCLLPVACCACVSQTALFHQLFLHGQRLWAGDGVVGVLTSCRSPRRSAPARDLTAGAGLAMRSQSKSSVGPHSCNPASVGTSATCDRGWTPPSATCKRCMRAG